MGTRLIARGLVIGEDDSSLWNLSHPEFVLAIHESDIAAGADVLLTNTFGANASWLARFGRAGDVAAINRRAAGLARDAAGPDRFVLGSIGPTAGWSEQSYCSQAETLAEAGVDALFLETHTPDEALAGLAQLRPRFSLPIFVGLITTVSDHEARTLIDRGADALGLNCCHPAEVRAWVEGLALNSPERGDSCSMIPLLSEPYASDPEGREIPPDEFAATIPGLLLRGVRLFGGCCGATEAHVAAMRSALDRATAERV